MPIECLAGPPNSLFYFSYKEGDKTTCVSLISESREDQKRVLNAEPTSGFTLMPNSQSINFAARVICDSSKAYPEFTVNLDSNNVAVYTIASKFSCGEIISNTQVTSDRRYLLGTIMIVIGMLLLYGAGISFDRLLIYIVILLGFVAGLFFLLSFFNFKINSGGFAVITGLASTIAVGIHYLVKAYKAICNILITIIGSKIGFSYGDILFPNSAMAERVD